MHVALPAFVTPGKALPHSPAREPDPQPPSLDSIDSGVGVGGGMGMLLGLPCPRGWPSTQWMSAWGSSLWVLEQTMLTAMAGANKAFAVEVQEAIWPMVGLDSEPHLPGDSHLVVPAQSSGRQAHGQPLLVVSPSMALGAKGDKVDPHWTMGPEVAGTSPLLVRIFASLPPCCQTSTQACPRADCQEEPSPHAHTAICKSRHGGQWVLPEIQAPTSDSCCQAPPLALGFALPLTG